MKVAITGSSGFIASRLKSHLQEKGHEVVFISRSNYENPAAIAETINGCEAVINLAGAPVSKPWTKEYKLEITNSRVITTRNLVAGIGLLENKPKVLISASGSGIYDSKKVHNDESTSYTKDFISNLSKQWEYEANMANQYQVRTVILRIGPVLDPEGGMLTSMVPMFRSGRATIIGSGKQSIPWIAADDIIGVIEFVLSNNNIGGIVNTVAPKNTTNAEISRLLIKKLKLKMLFQVPSLFVRFKLGEMADLVIKGQKIVPEKLLNAGYKFRFETIEDYFKQLKI